MPRSTSKLIERFILEHLDQNPDSIATLAARHFGISRQAVHRHLNKLIQNNQLAAWGNTSHRKYGPVVWLNHQIQVQLTPNLEEDRVWHERIEPHLQNIPENISRICHFGFTEMFNNALDHSQGAAATVTLYHSSTQIALQVFDDGIGIFNKLKTEHSLAAPRDAVLELAKGKLTTDPSRYTGQGIFFTSRSFDSFTIVSGKLAWHSREAENSWIIDDLQQPQIGTGVIMRISSLSDRTLVSVFDRFAGKDYQFTKTHIPVELAKLGESSLISRSQAKRLVSRFEEFDEIILDFKGITSIGQAFADEIFRVFKNNHPSVMLKPVNIEPEIGKMIDRAESAAKSR